MKIWLAVLLLCGCAWGQDSTICLKKHIADKGLTDIEHCHAVVPHWVIWNDYTETVGDAYHPHYLSFGKSGLQIAAPLGNAAKTGDCYRVGKDMKLEKVECCGNQEYGIVAPDQYPHNGIIRGLEPGSATMIVEPVDIPAEMTTDTNSMVRTCKKGETATVGSVYCLESMPRCDKWPSRIMMGPDGNGKWFCHLPQTN